MPRVVCLLPSKKGNVKEKLAHTRACNPYDAEITEMLSSISEIPSVEFGI